MTKLTKLIFVYNAKSGIANKMLDSLHKMVSPKTYSCDLCSITHGLFQEKKIWKNFRENSNISMEFLYPEEFQKQYASKFGHKFTFPIILFPGDNGLEILISSLELKTINTPEKLIAMIKNRMQPAGK